MPWTPKDAQSHHSGANTKKLRRIWSSTANSVLDDTGDEGRAVRIANDAVNRAKKKTQKAEAEFLLRLLR